MTGHQIDNFVGSLVEMAKAFEERPGLHRHIEELEININAKVAANQALEDSNAILRGHIDELNAKLAEVSKERDDASFRVLEVEDKASRVLDLAKTLQTGLGQVIAEVEPPKSPDPVEVSNDAFQKAIDEMPKPMEGFPGNPLPGTFPEAAPATGQSEPDPTVGSTDVTMTNVPLDAQLTGAPSIDALADKPYAGRRWSELGYHEKPYNRDAWYAGGGDDNGWNA